MKLSVITALALITSISYSASAHAADAARFFVYGRFEKPCDAEPTENWWQSYNRSADYSTMAEANDRCTQTVHPISNIEPVSSTVLFNHFDAEQGKCRGAIRVEYNCSPFGEDGVIHKSVNAAEYCSQPKYDESVWLNSYNAYTDRAVLAKAKQFCADMGMPNVEQVGPMVRRGRILKFPDGPVCDATSEIKFRCRE